MKTKFIVLQIAATAFLLYYASGFTQAVFILALSVIGLYLINRQKLNENWPSSKGDWILVLIAAATFVFSRLIFFAKGNLINFGYDGGFYLYAISHLKNFNLFSAWGAYQNPVFFLNKIFNFSPAGFLNFWYLLANAGTAAALYLYLRRFGRSAGALGALLFAGSVAAVEAYSFYLWKNNIALPFLILALYFIDKKKWLPAALSSMVILLSHRTTAIIYGLFLAVYIVLSIPKTKKNWLILSASAFLAAAAVFFTPLYSFFINFARNFFSQPNPGLTQGIFLTGQSYWSLSAAAIILVVPGILLSGKKAKDVSMVYLFALTFLWVVLKMPFYQRIFIFVDIAAVCFAAIALAKLMSLGKQPKITASIVLLLFMAQGLFYAATKDPQISTKEIQEISQVSSAQRKAFVLALSSRDAPWILAYSVNSGGAAPGLFDDRLTYEEWVDFYNGHNQKLYLTRFPKPLLIYSRSINLAGEYRQCLNSLSENFSEYLCK